MDLGSRSGRWHQWTRSTPSSPRSGVRRRAAQSLTRAEIFGDLQSADNPLGVVNMGIAESSLGHPDLVKRFNSNLRLTEQDLTYGDSWSGSKRLARAVSELFNDHFAPVVPVKPDQLMFGCGVSAVVDQLTSVICDPDEALLTARPFYNGPSKVLVPR